MVQYIQTHLGPYVDDSVPNEGGQLDLLIDDPTQGNLAVTEGAETFNPVAKAIL